jgi:hypothetical protein
MRPNGSHYSPSEPRVSSGPPAADGSRGCARTPEPELASLRSYALGTYKPGRVPRVPFGSYASHPMPARSRQRKARAVPVHPHLVEMGFPEFAQRMLASIGPDGPLFYRKPDRPSRNPKYRGPAVKARERLANRVRGLGVSDPGIGPNHAWRHLFRTTAAGPALRPALGTPSAGTRLAPLPRAMNT